MSFDRMIEKIVETQNPTVAGLDPKLAYIPSYILDGAVAKYGKTLEAAAGRTARIQQGPHRRAVRYCPGRKAAGGVL